MLLVVKDKDKDKDKVHRNVHPVTHRPKSDDSSLWQLIPSWLMNMLIQTVGHKLKVTLWKL